MNRFFKAFQHALFFGLASVMLIACSQKDIDSYSDNPAIYFLYDNVFAETYQLNKYSQSFFTLGSVQTDTLTVFVKMTGFPQDYDRPIKLVQTNVGEAYAAVEGKHFVSWDNKIVKNSLTIKAGTVLAKVKIVVNRYENEDDEANRMDLHEFSLKLGLAENEYFRPGIQEYREFEITMTSMASKPSNWDTFWKSYFGMTWGTRKMQFIIDVTGYTDWETRPLDMSYLIWMRDEVARAFFQYNKANPDNLLKEADGTLVKFL